jgi:hypothetical protein
MAAQDVCRLLYSSRSLSHVREILSRLAATNYLYRFELPHTSTGNTEKICTLGSRGRDFLVRELGLPVDWYFRPAKTKHLSFSQVLHSLLLARTLVAIAAWCAKKPSLNLGDVRICYELAREAATVEVRQETLPADKPRKTEKLKVISDAWVEFERNDGINYPILLELDRGMEYSRKFKHHVRSRIEFIRSGAYKKCFKLMLC